MASANGQRIIAPMLKLDGIRDNSDTGNDGF